MAVAQSVTSLGARMTPLLVFFDCDSAHYYLRNRFLVVRTTPLGKKLVTLSDLCSLLPQDTKIA